MIQDMYTLGNEHNDLIDTPRLGESYNMNQISPEERTLIRIQINSDKARIIDAVCINCNKRFKSMRAVSMHLEMTARRHAVNFINYGNYDKKTGLRERHHAED